MEPVNLNVPQTVTFRVERADGQGRDIKINLDPAFYTHKTILGYLAGGQYYEPETVAAMRLLLGAGDRFVDVGAHVGFFSIVAGALVGPTGRVFSFEPNLDNYRRLVDHLAHNQMDYIVPFNWAVGDKPGLVSLFANTDNDGGHSLWNPAEHPLQVKSQAAPPQAQAAYISTLDDVFIGGPGAGATGWPKMIKIDVEGNELAVLKGGRELLSKVQPPAVIAEVNPFALAKMGATVEEMYTFMEQIGYTTYSLIGDTPVRLRANQQVKWKHIFNVMFASKALQQIVEPQWPQDATTGFERLRPAMGDDTPMVAG